MDISHKDKIRIQDLEDKLDSIDLSKTIYTGGKKYYLDTSINPSNWETRKKELRSFANTSGYIVNYAVTKKFNTGPVIDGGNNLTVNDLALLYNYAQNQSDTNHREKDVWFEEHPIVDVYKSTLNLDDDQLLTDTNITDLEDSLAREERYPCSMIPAFNWRNENPFETICDISSFIPTTENEERSTYKIEYNRRDINDGEDGGDDYTIALSNFVKLDSNQNVHRLKGVIYYSVIGLVSVKSTIEEQDTGTIYLEAKNDNGDWVTIDSACFKFLNETNENSSPGTYVTLSGYLTTDCVTRLKLNLNPQGYSMNVHTNRLTDQAFVTNGVNTFVGFAYAPCNNDPIFGKRDPTKYFCIQYRYPVAGSYPEGAPTNFLDEMQAAWSEFDDVDNDSGVYELAEQQPSFYTNNNQFPPQYRHVRWKNRTRDHADGKEYIPGQTVTLTTSNTFWNSTDNTYEYTVEAIYKQIYYYIFYDYGDIGNLVERKVSKPTYSYKIEYPKYGIDYIYSYGSEKYKMLCWIDITNGNRERYFGKTMELSDKTTTPKAGDTDPATNRELHLEAKYAKVRYTIIYDPGIAAGASQGAWSLYEDNNGGNYYKYNASSSAYTLHGLRPGSGHGQVVESTPGLIYAHSRKYGRTLWQMHYAWEIKGVVYKFGPNGECPKIPLSNDLVEDADKVDSNGRIKEGAWPIRVKALYKPRFTIEYNPNGGNGSTIIRHILEGETHRVLGSQGWTRNGAPQIPLWIIHGSENVLKENSILTGNFSDFPSNQYLRLDAVYAGNANLGTGYLKNLSGWTTQQSGNTCYWFQEPHYFTYTITNDNLRDLYGVDGKYFPNTIKCNIKYGGEIWNNDNDMWVAYAVGKIWWCKGSYNKGKIYTFNFPGYVTHVYTDGHGHSGETAFKEKWVTFTRSRNTDNFSFTLSVRCWNCTNGKIGPIEIKFGN